MSLTKEQKDYLEMVAEKQAGKEYFDIAPNTSIKVYDYHIKTLGLKNSKLLLYELIYGFTIGTPHQLFEGSAKYLAVRLGINRQKVLKYLKELTEEGYIYKVIKNGYPTYAVRNTTIPADDDDYIIIDHKYIEKGLKGSKLLIYSYINGLTKQDLVYWNTQSFMARKFNITRVSVCNCLNELEKEGFIEKYDTQMEVELLYASSFLLGKHIYTASRDLTD